MVNAMLPEQISAFWDVIKYGIERSLPPFVGDHPDKMNRILSALLSGKLICWAAYQVDGDNRKFEGILITEILHDKASDTKNLLIYCAYGYEHGTPERWLYGLKVILKYAKSKGCTNVVAYTTIPYMVNLAKSMGGSAEWTYCMFNVKSLMQELIGGE